MAAGLDAARRSESVEPVSEGDLRFCDFCDAIERAELDYQASLLDDILTLARPRTVRRVTVKEELLRDRGRLVYDDQGAPIVVRTCQVVESEVADPRVLLDRLERRFPAALAPNSRPGADDDVEYLAGGPAERRLAENLERFKRTLPLRLDANDLDEWCVPQPVAAVAIPEWPNEDDDDLLVPWSALDAAALDADQAFLVAEYVAGK